MTIGATTSVGEATAVLAVVCHVRGETELRGFKTLRLKCWGGRPFYTVNVTDITFRYMYEKLIFNGISIFGNRE